MRPHRVLTALAGTLIVLVGGTMLVATPAHAGNWAVTVLDPVPDHWEAGKGYTVGMWVLQHGFHPFEGDLGPVALRLIDDKGVAVSFPAVALPEPAHYAAAIAVPQPGTWAVVGAQGRFADYHIGTLSVPGSLSVLGVPVPLQPSEIDKYWPGAIRPPSVAVDESRDPFGPVVAAPLGANVAAAAPVAPAAPAPPRRTSPLAILVGIGTMVAIAGLLGSRRRWWPHRRAIADGGAGDGPVPQASSSPGGITGKA
jgi:hypothetical protein